MQGLGVGVVSGIQADCKGGCRLTATRLLAHGYEPHGYEPQWLVASSQRPGGWRPGLRCPMDEEDGSVLEGPTLAHLGRSLQRVVATNQTHYIIRPWTRQCSQGSRCLVVVKLI